MKDERCVASAQIRYSPTLRWISGPLSLGNLNLKPILRRIGVKGEYGDWIFSDEHPRVEEGIDGGGTFSRGGKFITRRREEDYNR